MVALPCYHLLAREFPDAQRVLLTNFPVNAKAPAPAAVLGDSGLVDGYMRYTVGTRRLGELLRLMLEIRRFKPDILVYLTGVRRFGNVRRDRLFFRLAGVRRIVGMPSEADLVRRFDSATGLYESERLRLGRFIGELGDARAGELASYDLRLTAAEREAASAALGLLSGKPLIVCGPGTKAQAKDWEQDKWRALLARLRVGYPEHGLALVGSQEDLAVSEYASQDWNGPKVNLCGKTSPRQTAAVIESADVFLGLDSGPMHLAASVGVSCVIAFSAHGLPGVWYPAGERHQIVYHQTECFGCWLDTCVAMKKECMRSITVDEMEQAVGRVLHRPAKEVELKVLH